MANQISKELVKEIKEVVTEYRKGRHIDGFLTQLYTTPQYGVDDKNKISEELAKWVIHGGRAPYHFEIDGVLYVMFASLFTRTDTRYYDVWIYTPVIDKIE